MLTPFIRSLQGYIEFTGTITCRTGLLISGGEVGLEIGGIDRSVIRDPVSQLPYIPGSSLKGKLRALVEKTSEPPLESLRPIEQRGFRHECDDIEVALKCRLCRIFGSTARGGEEEDNRNLPAALIIWDCLLTPGSDIQMEYKMENTLDRLTAAAIPRLFERVPPGTQFPLHILLRMEDVRFIRNQVDEKRETPNVTETGQTEEQPRDAWCYDEIRLREDVQTLLTALWHLEYEGLGSSVSRGYGRVAIRFDTVKIINRQGTMQVPVSAAQKPIKDLAASGQVLSQVCDEFVIHRRSLSASTQV